MSSMRFVWPSILAASALCACDYTEYEVHVEPAGGGFERSLYAWNVLFVLDDSPIGGPHRLSKEHARSLAALYGEAEFEPEATLRASFERSTPADLGGAGRYLHIDTPLGSLLHYQERVGGGDDLVGRFERARAASERVAELALAWFQSELGEAPQWAVLAPQLGEHLARDIANLVLSLQLDYGYRRALLGGEGADGLEGIAVRLAMYCVERGYFELDDLPVLLRAAYSDSGDEELASLEPLRRMVARRMGIEGDGPYPEQLDFLVSTQSIRRSWERFSSSPRCVELAEQWPTPEEGKPEMELLRDLLGWELGLSPDRLKLSLATADEPHWTNGHFDAAASCVRWELAIPDSRGLPALCYATWAAPAEAEQLARFGAVPLRGQALLNYALWYASLTRQEREDWEGQLATLDPTRSLGPQLEGLTPPAVGGDFSDPRASIAEGLELDSAH